MLSGLAGMISAFRISAASPVAGTGYELEVIAMVVVGGTALTGGRGTILGTVIGTFMLRAIRNGIVLVGVPGLAFNIFVGAIILVMLVLHAADPASGERDDERRRSCASNASANPSAACMALKSASMILREGEVVALLGDNGAGKSTLIKAISGVHPADGGAIYVRGEKASIRSARDAIELGIETIHQDTSLAPDLSIARNLFLGREPVKLPFLGVFAPIDFPKLRRAASSL